MNTIDTFIEEKQQELKELCKKHKIVCETWELDFLEKSIRQTAREVVEDLLPKEDVREYEIEAWRNYKSGWNNSRTKILATAKEKGII